MRGNRFFTEQAISDMRLNGVHVPLTGSTGFGEVLRAGVQGADPVVAPYKEP